MNDLIKILNNPEEHYPGNFDTPQRANALLTGLCQDAANEIERLNAEVLEQCRINGMSAEREDALAAELTRLKASIALDKMAENARELGLDYEPAPVQEPVAQALSRDAVLANIAGWLRHLADDVTIPYFTNGAFKADCNEAADVLLATPPTPQPVPVKTYHDGKPWPVAPKPWVGLTEAEIEELHGSPLDQEPHPELELKWVRTIEAKLKEKNHDQ